MGKYNIEYLGIDEIKPFEINPKIHNEKQINLVAKSITKFGFKNPIIIDKNNVIVLGHCRFFVSKQLELKEVPIIKAENLTEEEINAFRVLDNKSSEMAEWEEGKLAELLKELEEKGISDLTGFLTKKFLDYWIYLKKLEKKYSR